MRLRSLLGMVLVAHTLGCSSSPGDAGTDTLPPDGADGSSPDDASVVPDAARASDADSAPDLLASTSVAVWLTTADGSQKLAPQPSIDFASAAGNGDANTITLHPETKYQAITGFGASLTDSAAWLFSQKMSAAQRASAFAALFDRAQGIGVDFLRQPMGTSDLAWSFYSYDDLPDGQTDPQLDKFSIDRDRPYIIPMVLEALRANPDTLVMGTPWSAPAWMKTNQSLTDTGDLIDPGSYPVYAQYFVKFVQQYQAAGIPIFAVTPVNEPLIQPVGYPSMSMQWWQEGNFVRYHLGPAFQQAGLSTRILLFDHNWDNASYPKQILDDNADVRGYTGGVAFHCYGGQPDAMDAVHDAWPDKDIYVTECSGGTWSGSFADSLKGQMQQLYIGSIRHWAKSVIRWNLALDDNHGPLPTSGGGCTGCTGLITIHDDGTFSPEVDYYAMGHLSRFVERGALRVDSNTLGAGSIEDVALVNPDGARVLLVLNSADGPRSFTVVDGERAFTATLPAGAAATYTWR